MEDINESPLSRTTHLGVAIGIALAVVTVLMWLLQGVSNAGTLAATLYVDGAIGSDTGNCQNPAAPCDSIGYAISQAVDGDEILITAITYNENLTITGESLTLIGGYTISGTQWMTSTIETIVDGGQAGRVFFFSGSDSVLENLTITNGKSPDMECWGDGVWVTNGDVTIRESTVKNNNFGCNGIEVNHDLGPAHLTLESSTVSDNGLTGAGGGLHVWGEFASADIVEVEFIGNSTDGYGGGISVDNQATAVIKDSRIISNTASGSGGGIDIRDGANSIITGTQISANVASSGSGGGIGAESSGNLSLFASRVVGNAALSNDAGGITAGGGGSATVQNSIIAGNNSGDTGGGFYFGSGGPFHIVNSHIVGNLASNKGSAIATVSGGVQVVVTNTLIISNAGNTGLDDKYGDGGIILLNYCDTYGNAPDGTSGVTITRTNCLGTPAENGVDPLMAGSALPGGVGPSYAPEWLSYDYHLLSNSPAIDSGTNVGAPIVDIDGDPRPIDGNLDGVAVTDMGAYEFRPQKVYVPILLKESE